MQEMPIPNVEKPLPPNQENAHFRDGLQDLWETVEKAPSKAAEKSAAFAKFLRALLPATILEMLYDKEKFFAVDPEKYQFKKRRIGAKSESYVYELVSLDPQLPSLVLKVDRREKSRSVDALLQRGKELRSDYERVKKWYREIPDILPEEMQYIGNDPVSGKNALFTLQEYFGGKGVLYDIGSMEPEDLTETLRENPKLLATVEKFVQITEQVYRRENRSLDFMGDHNISLQDTDEEPRLIILDPHDLHSGTLDHPAFGSTFLELRDAVREAKKRLQKAQESGREYA